MRLDQPSPIKRALRSVVACLLAPACIALSCAAAFAQDSPRTSAKASAPAPSFEVATIKPHSSGPASMIGLMYTPDGLTGSMVTLTALVTQAYGVLTENQVQGAPDWAKTDRFDIQAKLSEADAAAMHNLNAEETKLRRQQILQAFLADRFHLKVHSDTKQAPVYELVVAKNGPKLKDAASDSSDNLRKGADGKPLTGIMYFLKDKTTAQGYTMTSLANLLSQPFSGVGRPVLDKTGLTGTYNFTFDWSPSMKIALPGAIAGDPGDEGPSIFTALADLGLRLQPSTGPIDVVVIDGVERPSEN